MAILLLSAALSSFAAAELAKAAYTGTILTFHRPRVPVQVDLEPWRFAYNVGMRIFGIFLFGGGGFLFWRQFRESLRS